MNSSLQFGIRDAWERSGIQMASTGAIFRHSLGLGHSVRFRGNSGHGGYGRKRDFQPLIFKMLLFLARANQRKRIGARSRALLHAGDDVGAAEPVRFRKVGERPLCRAIGMRVIEADDIELLFACLPLSPNQFFRRDVVAIRRTIGARVAGTQYTLDFAMLAFARAQQNAATLVRIALFAVAANVVEIEL